MQNKKIRYLSVKLLYKIIRIIDCIRIHHCISTIIDLEAPKFCHDLLHDPILPNLNLHHVVYLTWWCYDHSHSQMSNLHVMQIIVHTNLVSDSMMAMTVSSDVKCKNEGISSWKQVKVALFSSTELIQLGVTDGDREHKSIWHPERLI